VVFRQSLAAMCVVSLALTIGCKSSSKQAQSNGGGLSQSNSTYPFNDPKYQSLVNEVQGENAKSSGMFATESTTSKITSKLKDATAAVGSALTLKPRITPAKDPISLASSPDQVTPNLYYQAARLAEHNKSPGEAIRQYNEALKVDQDHLPSLIGLARLYDRNGQFELAVEAYRKSISVAPDNAMAHNDLALCLARNGKNPEALSELRRATELEPTRKLYRNNLATILVDNGQFDAALAEMNAVHPPATAHYNVAFLLVRSGRETEARPYLYRAAQLDPSMQVAVDLMQQIDARTNAAATAQRTPNQVGDQQPAVPARMVNAQPVSTSPPPAHDVQSPLHLRRVPPTAAGTPTTPSPPPVLGMPSPSLPPANPVTGEGYQMQFPVRKMSGYTVDDPTEPLPLPADLETLQPSKEEPQLEPAERVRRSVSG
jgi:Flp pilus assembly protein TadD